jgi:asparagine synthase (glutamine-hydrolysing)
VCGIAAVLDADGVEPGFEDGPRWSACLDGLARRGPDGHGTWRSASGVALLGHTRLSIVDPSEAGAQPMVSGDGRYALTYNGELYNAPVLRRTLEAAGHRFRSACDTEVLLRGFVEWGERVLGRVHGMYAFALWDDRERALFAAVDHAGMKPLCWSLTNDRMCIGSDCDAVRALTGGDEPLDATGLRRLLTLSCSPPPGTVWRGIQKLPPGHALRWRPGSAARVSRHWSPPSSVDERAGGVRGERFDALFDDVMREHMIADVPVGAFLSGGIDSAAIAAGVVRAGERPLCFTLSMDGPADESADAGRVAAQLDLPHAVAEAGADVAGDLGAFASAFDEPQGYSALLTAVRLAGFAAESRKAVVAGDGGDEAFGGYLWQRERGTDAWQALPGRAELLRDGPMLAARVREPGADDDTRKAARLAFGARSFVHAYASRVFPGFHPAEALALTADFGGTFHDDDAVCWLCGEDRPELPHLRRVQRLDLTGFCAASILPKIDRAAMACGIEVRAPLLDRRLLEIGMSAPVRDGETLHDSSASRPELRRLVRARVGAFATTRAKQGFSLRVADEHRRWSAFVVEIDSGPLVHGGVLRRDWAAFVPVGDTPRLRLLVMLNRWARGRL